MHPLDIAIVIAYLLMMVAVGWVVARLAARNPESYFLAGKSLPWWMIGIAHGSSGLDISGTMWFVMVLFVYGVKGVWLLWVWPLFNVIFRMVYLGTWVRRSNVLTGAEWMYTRFGRNRGTELAYLSMVVYAIVSVVGFLSLAYIGIGKFTASFIPFEALGLSAAALPGNMTPADFFAVVIMLIAGIYCVAGGMYSVVMNDLIQFALIVIASIIIGAIAIGATSSQDILSAVPDGWDRMFFGWRLNLDWAARDIPQLNNKLYNPVGAGGDGYSIFGLFVLMLFLKGVLVSMAGPTPNYAIQHVLSTRSPREAALENLMMAIASLAPRFLLIAGIGTLGIAYFGPEIREMAAGGKVDFERILPDVVNRHLPIGAKGLILAGLLAAFMSTFVSTVNSGAAYIVNDIYKRYIDPHGSPRRYVLLSYLCSIGIIALGIGFGFVTQSVHSITEVLVSVIVPAFVIPNVIKWHWWRFNGYGFFAGMVAGTLSALVLLFLKADYMKLLGLTPITLHPVYVVFPTIMALATIASVVVCLLTRPEEDDVLKRFYRTVRPWGFWEPIYQKCRAEDPTLEPNRDFARDWFNVIVGIIWELAMVAAPIFLVIRQYGRTLICFAVFAVTSAILKFTWYNNLEPAESAVRHPAGALDIAPGSATP